MGGSGQVLADYVLGKIRLVEDNLGGAETLLARAVEFQPDIIGLSGLLTSAYDSMQDTISLLRQASEIELAQAPIIIGGGTLNEQVCRYVGADYWIVNSMEGVRLCQKLVGEG